MKLFIEPWRAFFWKSGAAGHRAALTGILAIGLGLFALTARADNQGFSSTWGTLTNLPTLLSNAVASASITNVIPLRVTSGIGIQTIFQGSNLVTAPVTLYVYPSVDGTNIENVGPWAAMSYPANGTNIVIGCTNWSNLALKGFAALFITVSNGTTANINLNQTLTNTATGQVYPGGVTYNRPNQ